MINELVRLAKRKGLIWDKSSSGIHVAKAARFARAKGAHDELIAKVHRAQADALEIEAMAKRRLADEYDAAQERGEVRPANARTASTPEAVSAADIGLTHKDIHEARQIRDAEVADPGGSPRGTPQPQLHGGSPARFRRWARARCSLCPTSQPSLR